MAKFYLGFMDPEGKLYACENYEHLDTAMKICEKLGYLAELEQLKPSNFKVDCERYLLAKGFLGIYSRTIQHSCMFNITIGNTKFSRINLSNVQERFIRDNLSNAFNLEQFDVMKEILEWNNNLKESK